MRLKTPYFRKNLRLFTGLIFLFMILSRMTWMQIRHDTLKYHGFLPPGLPWSSFLRAETWISWNVGMVVLTLFFTMLLVRFLTGSWLVALFSGTVLMSRGAIMVRVSWYSLDLTMSLVASAWFCCLAHHMKTASPFSLFLSWFCLLLGATLQPAFIVLGLLFPLFTLLVNGRGFKTTAEFHTGSVFRTLDVTYTTWLKHSAIAKRYSWMVLTGTIAFVALWFFAAFPSVTEWERPPFYFSQTRFLDLHYLLSLSIIVWLAVRAFAKDDNFLHFQAVVIGSLLLWVGGVFLFYRGSWVPHAPFAVLVWLEPIVLGIGAAGGLVLVTRKLPARQFVPRYRNGKWVVGRLNKLTEDN